MRIRQVKPAFWTDAKLAQLTEPARLFYIGLWMVADDAGWFRLDVAEIAHELYGYQDRRPREAKVTRLLAELEAAGRIIRHDCGHGEIPRMTEHQRLAGSTKQVKSSYNEHWRRCVSQVPADPRGFPQVPADPRTSPTRLGKEREQVEVREGTSSPGTARPPATSAGGQELTESEFRRLAGVPAFLEPGRVS